MLLLEQVIQSSKNHRDFSPSILIQEESILRRCNRQKQTNYFYFFSKFVFFFVKIFISKDSYLQRRNCKQKLWLGAKMSFHDQLSNIP